MKKHIYKLAIISFVGLSIGACKSLDESDPTRIPEEKVVKDVKALDKLNQGFYLALPASLNWYAQSLITDELVLNINDNLGGGKMYYTWDYGPGTIEDRDNNMGLFRGYYNVVRRANLTINNIDSAPVTTEADVALKNVLKAEALGMRAFCHFNILQLFSPKYAADALGCVYVTKVDDDQYPARDNMKTSYDNVLKDINDAMALMPASIPAGYSGATQNNRITLKALQALRAKVALEIGDYDGAIEYANKILATSSLTTAANFPDLWSDKNDYSEVLLKVTNLASSGNTPGVLFYNTSSQIQYNASATLQKKYSATDIRGKLFQEIKDKGMLPLKYLKPSFDGVKPNRGLADIKLIRTAEILLLKAEAYARKGSGDLANAFTSYKILRDARNAGESVAFTSQQDALDKILEERDRELCYEGFRLSDIKRFGKTVARDAADSRANYTNLTFTDVNKFTLPIPQAEIFSNPNIKQNTGW
ncbi:TPA: RagB/SusD family nutrient uptake outer membrane protein [Elizabethkingia anophelis]